MIQEYADDLAAQAGMQLSRITLTEGCSLGCLDASLLSLELNGKLVSIFIHQTEIDTVQNGSHNELLELKIRSALVRLKMLLEP